MARVKWIGTVRSWTRRLFSPKYLLLTNTISSGVLLALGDVLQQLNEQRIARKKILLKEVNAASAQADVSSQMKVSGLQLHEPEADTVPKFNWTRTGRMLTIGTLLGPLNHYWYSGLDRFLPGVKGRTVAKKILLDELIASPVMTTTFFVGMGLLEGKTFGESVDVLRKKFLTVYMIDWCVWPVCQAVNFTFIPSRFRVVYVNCVTLAWDTFLSFIIHTYEP